jgi:hypothetical protein
VDHIAVDSAGRELRNLDPGTTVPLYTREETVLEQAADWVYTADEGLTFFGRAEGPFQNASYSVEREDSASSAAQRTADH